MGTLNWTAANIHMADELAWDTIDEVEATRYYMTLTRAQRRQLGHRHRVDDSRPHGGSNKLARVLVHCRSLEQMNVARHLSNMSAGPRVTSARKVRLQALAS